MKLKTLIACEAALAKLFPYGYLPARQIYYLSTMQRQTVEAIESYHNARNSLLIKYGASEDGKQYQIIGEDNVKSYQAESSELDEQEAGFCFDESKISLCVESIEKTESGLPPDKRLGFSANDWLAIREIIKVTETE